MNKFRFTFKIFVFTVIALAFPLLVNAQATRTWVSGVGDDVNPCSRTAPCKTFAGAISKTATNGEINCLDPAGYGAVNITKSLTIDCEDTQGSILASLVNGVIINNSTSTVRLRGISINGAGNGINGIRILAASKVVLEEMVIDNFSQHGVSVETTSGTTKISVWNSSFRDNTGNGINTFITGTSSVLLTVSNSMLSGNATGLSLTNATKATIYDSTSTNNTTGLVAANAEMTIRNVNVSNNTTGIQAFSGGTMRMTASTVTGNTNGLVINAGGTILSVSDNFILGNTTDGAPNAFGNLN